MTTKNNNKSLLPIVVSVLLHIGCLYVLVAEFSADRLILDGAGTAIQATIVPMEIEANDTTEEQQIEEQKKKEAFENLNEQKREHQKQIEEERERLQQEAEEKALEIDNERNKQEIKEEYQTQMSAIDETRKIEEQAQQAIEAAQKEEARLLQEEENTLREKQLTEERIAKEAAAKEADRIRLAEEKALREKQLIEEQKAKETAAKKEAEEKQAKEDSEALEKLLETLATTETDQTSTKNTTGAEGISDQQIADYWQQVESAVRIRLNDYRLYRGKSCDLRISVSPNGGRPTTVSIVRGDETLCRLARSAALQANIPKPSSPMLYERVKNAILVFEPK